MKKGENILIVIISFALVVCVVMGCVAAFKRIGDIFSEEDAETTDADRNNSNVDNVSYTMKYYYEDTLLVGFTGSEGSMTKIPNWSEFSGIVSSASGEFLYWLGSDGVKYYPNHIVSFSCDLELVAVLVDCSHSDTYYKAITSAAHEERCSSCGKLISSSEHDYEYSYKDDTSCNVQCLTCDSNLGSVEHRFIDGKCTFCGCAEN